MDERSHHHHQGKQQKYIRGEWLNLRLGRKIFNCKFCNREFYSSQALGGHQNAHKREKTMLEHCSAAAAAATATATAAAMMMSPSSHGVQPHSLVDQPGDKGGVVTASEPSRLGAVRHPFAPHFQEPQNYNSAAPGSSSWEEHYPSFNSDVLDLDLKL